MITLAHCLGRSIVTINIHKHTDIRVYLPCGEMKSKGLPDVSDDDLVRRLLGTDGRSGWLGTYRLYVEQGTQCALQCWQEEMYPILGDIHKRLIKPIHDLVAPETGIVFLTTNGPLLLLPLHAAWDGKSEEAYLLDSFDVQYAYSYDVLRRCLRHEPCHPQPVLSIVMPQYLSLSTWYGAAVERTVGVRAWTTSRLWGVEATCGAVVANLQDHPVTHFFCHGIWDARNPWQSRLDLADAHLTVQDVTSLSLSGWFAVLGACESAVEYTSRREAEGYFGFPTAFLLAGYSSVVGSLWRVKQISSALLLCRFFEALLGSDTPSVPSALREAHRAGFVSLVATRRKSTSRSVCVARAHGMGGFSTNAKGGLTLRNANVRSSIHTIGRDSLPTGPDFRRERHEHWDARGEPFVALPQNVPYVTLCTGYLAAVSGWELH